MCPFRTDLVKYIPGWILLFCLYILMYDNVSFKLIHNIYSTEGVGRLGLYTRFSTPKPGLQSRALRDAVCIINSYSTLINWPIVSLLILFILYSTYFVLIHDYTLCFTGSPCCNFSYYNYISIWALYIVIHSIVIWWILKGDHILQCLPKYIENSNLNVKSILNNL